MAAYENFAQVYDLFMDNVDYDGWSRYLTGLLRHYGVSGGLVCELGCGTGSMTERLAAAGYDMIGIDASADMLAAAMEKRAASGRDILYLEQDMRAFELYGTVRAIVSVCDCMNYLLTEDDLRAVFRLANNYLDPGGVFIFDLNTAHKYAQIGDTTIAENRDEGSFIWENIYDRAARLNEYNLTLFLPEPQAPLRPHAEGPFYRKYEEIHTQRAWTAEEIRRLLAEAGMTCEAMFKAFTTEAPDAATDRLYVVARERGKARA